MFLTKLISKFRESENILSDLSSVELDIPRKPITLPAQILLINPNNFIESAIKRMFFQYGIIKGKHCNIIKTWSLEQALNEIRLSPPDLIISSSHFQLTGEEPPGYIFEEKLIGYKIINLLKKTLHLNIPVIFTLDERGLSYNLENLSSSLETKILNFMKTEALAYFEDFYDEKENFLNTIRKALNFEDFSPGTWRERLSKREPFNYSLVSEEIANYLKKEAWEINQITMQQQEKSNRGSFKIGEKLSKIRLLLEDELFIDWLKEINLSSQSSRDYIWISNNFRNCSEQIIDNIKFPLAQLALLPPSVMEKAISIAESGEEINETKLEEIKQKYLLNLD